MINKKRILALFLFAISVAFAFPAAAAYTPLVRLPGLPASGNINLSMYLVGLYNFLVSIVGIVAVMMMIVGGMRYITAGGSQTAISDAKDMISSAISGLVIAIFAWVIVSAINPDVLYIKSGGGTAIISYPFMESFVGPSTCKCIDGYTFINPPDALPLPASAEECNTRCKAEHGAVRKISCIRGGIDDIADYKFKLPDPNNGKCLCADGKDVEPDYAAFPPLPAPRTCNMVCDDPAFTADATDTQSHCGFDFIRIKLDVTGADCNVVLPATCPTPLPFNLTPATEIWEFFLTNDGKYEDIYDINAKSNGIYECAILISEERSWWWDNNCIFWVTPGSKIRRDGISLARDINDSGAYQDINGCGVFAPGPCGMNPAYLGCSADTNQVFRAYYSEDVIDTTCTDCSMSQTKKYRPKNDIICDPSSKRWKILY